MSKASNHPRKAKAPRKSPAGAERAPSRKPSRAPGETARYIAEFSAELSLLAQQARLDLLAYLLDMARTEAIRAVQAQNGDQ
jgi:hypothetical protein